MRPPFHSLLAESYTLAALLMAGLSNRAYCQTPDSFNPGPDDQVFSIAPQSDGKILVLGGFQNLDGQKCSGFGRLNADGSFDRSFVSPIGISYGPLVLDEDGKTLTPATIMLGGSFSNYLLRIAADGSRDATFAPVALAEVDSLAIQSDGKILVGGRFDSAAGQIRTNIARLNPDGSVDLSFNPGTSALGNESVQSVAIQPDGKILVGGRFAALAGQACTNLGRLNPDGSLDVGFHGSASGVSEGTVPAVSYLTLQADLKILANGFFTMLAGQACTNLGRLQPDGSFDTNFNATADSDVQAIALQCDGKIILGGLFAALDGQTRTNLGRLNADGTLDANFTTGVDTNMIPISPDAAFGPVITSLALCEDGKLVIGGLFINVGGFWRTNLARLNNTDISTQSLVLDGSAITWLRQGTGPEIWRTTFAACTNGQDWFGLGAGTRISGGWQLSGVTLPASATVRARGFVQDQRASWVVETVIGKPVISQQPLDQTNNAATLATFSAFAGGTPPVSYQWNKDGTLMSDGSNAFGTHSSMLTLSNVLHADAGSYSATVSNSFGTVTSRVATLTVIDPTISTQPVDQVANEGGVGTFTAGANGTSPLYYQWLKNGVSLAGATTPTLVITNIQRTDSGCGYQAIVTNLWGSTTSGVAKLTVNLALPDGFNPAPNGEVDAIAVQPDGKIVVGGYFSSLGATPRNFIGRLNGDGSLDTGFNPGTNLTGRAVQALALQADGSIVVGGDFSTLDGQVGLLWLRADGTRDTGFQVGLGGVATTVTALAIQNDGKTLVGGIFSTLGGASHTNLGRLNVDGTVDSSFGPNVSSGLLSVAVQPDGRIVVGGFPGDINGVTRNGIGRLNTDGALDTSFAPTSDSTVYAVGIQADGKIVLGGVFVSLDNVALRSEGQIGRLNSDGTLDTSFNPGANGPVESLAVEADGRILVIGEFTQLAGEPRSSLGRLNIDGSLDPTLDLQLGSAGSYIDCVAVQTDGGMLVGGAFDAIAGQPRQQLARVSSTDPVPTSLGFDGSTITWSRGGPAPEVVRATFQASTNGSDWFLLGNGQRVAGGWRLENIALPLGSSIGASGYVQVGAGHSGWFVEDTVTVSPFTAPIILVNDGGFGLVSNGFGFNVGGLIGQTIVVEGSGDFRNWTPLTTNLVETGRFHFSDSSGAEPPMRFYRARLQ